LEQLLNNSTFVVRQRLSPVTYDEARPVPSAVELIQSIEFKEVYEPGLRRFDIQTSATGGI
jgi:hypothetical protein